MKRNEIIHERLEYKTVREMVEDVGDRFCGKVAYSYRLNPRAAEPETKNYETLRDDVRALTTQLISMGLAGKHIALVGKLSYNWVLVYYSAMCMGSVLAPLDRDWLGKDLADTAAKADAAIVFCDSDVREKGEEMAAFVGIGAPVLVDGNGEGSLAALVEAGREKLASGDKSYYEAEIDPDALALLVFTSGTTGKGKGVMLSQHNILSDMADVLPFIDFGGKTVGVLPPHHTYGSSVNILGHNCIGVNVYISAGLRYVAKELKEEQPEHLILVPLYLETFYRRIMATLKEQKKDKLVFRMIKFSNFLRKLGIDVRKKLFGKVLASFGGKVKMIISGGAAINQDIVYLFDGLGITVLNGYGITECAPIIAVNHSRRVVRGSVGFPLPIDTVKIDQPNEDGEGEILVKGSNIMLGYYKDEEATKDAFDEEGYFRTGDYGKLDKDGALFITGRKKNLIILSNGKNVYPEEIENEFVSVPGVLDVVVYEGQSRRGMAYNTIVCEIYPDKDYLEKNGIEDVSGHLQPFVDEFNRTAPPYKKIGVLKVRDEEFPKNTLRKIMRFKMDMTID